MSLVTVTATVASGRQGSETGRLGLHCLLVAGGLRTGVGGRREGGRAGSVNVRKAEPCTLNFGGCSGPGKSGESDAGTQDRVGLSRSLRRPEPGSCFFECSQRQERHLSWIAGTNTFFAPRLSSSRRPGRCSRLPGGSDVLSILRRPGRAVSGDSPPTRNLPWRGGSPELYAVPRRRSRRGTLAVARRQCPSRKSMGPSHPGRAQISVAPSRARGPSD
jgi:hypothetical protein